MTTNARLLLLAVSFLLSFAPSIAQDEDVIYRREIGGGLGAGFSFNDANTKFFGNTNFAANAILRFNLNKRMVIKTTLGYLGVKGSMTDVESFVPADINQAASVRSTYSFSGAVIDLNVLYELNFLPYGYIQDYRGMKRVTPYIQLGLGMSYGTAGKAFTGNIPLGIGLRWKVAERLNLGVDWLMHFSLSDKLDDIDAPLGIKSTMFKNKDHYSRVLLTLTYDISPRCPNCQKDD